MSLSPEDREALIIGIGTLSVAQWYKVKELLAVDREAGRLAALDEAEQIIRAHARDCGCWERMLADVDRERDGTSVFSSGAGAAGVQEPAKTPADTGPAPDYCLLCDKPIRGGSSRIVMHEDCAVVPGVPTPELDLHTIHLRAEREAGRREGRLAALTVAAADIRLLASEADARGILEVAARRIESIARGENLCSICRRYHGKEITHACE